MLADARQAVQAGATASVQLISQLKCNKHSTLLLRVLGSLQVERSPALRHPLLNKYKLHLNTSCTPCFAASILYGKPISHAQLRQTFVAKQSSGIFPFCLTWPRRSKNDTCLSYSCNLRVCIIQEIKLDAQCAYPFAAAPLALPIACGAVSECNTSVSTSSAC